MHEQSISFNVNELGVILSALQLLETTDENRIAKEYTSVPTLHDRLQSIYNKMDKQHITPAIASYDHEQSY